METENDESLLIQSKNWEKFYKFNKTNFFKDRHYILKEFTELKDDEREGKYISKPEKFIYLI
jgi:hypothetical protein